MVKLCAESGLLRLSPVLRVITEWLNILSSPNVWSHSVDHSRRYQDRHLPSGIGNPVLPFRPCDCREKTCNTNEADPRSDREACWLVLPCYGVSTRRNIGGPHNGIGFSCGFRGFSIHKDIPSRKHKFSKNHVCVLLQVNLQRNQRV